jgi:hypothetical protein
MVSTSMITLAAVSAPAIHLALILASEIAVILASEIALILASEIALILASDIFLKTGLCSWRLV